MATISVVALASLCLALMTSLPRPNSVKAAVVLTSDDVVGSSQPPPSDDGDRPEGGVEVIFADPEEDPDEEDDGGTKIKPLTVAQMTEVAGEMIHDDWMVLLCDGLSQVVKDCRGILDLRDYLDKNGERLSRFLSLGKRRKRRQASYSSPFSSWSSTSWNGNDGFGNSLGSFGSFGSGFPNRGFSGGSSYGNQGYSGGGSSGNQGYSGGGGGGNGGYSGGHNSGNQGYSGGGGHSGNQGYSGGGGGGGYSSGTGGQHSGNQGYSGGGGHFGNQGFSGGGGGGYSGGGGHHSGGHGSGGGHSSGGYSGGSGGNNNNNVQRVLCPTPLNQSAIYSLNPDSADYPANNIAQALMNPANLQFASLCLLREVLGDDAPPMPTVEDFRSTARPTCPFETRRLYQYQSQTQGETCWVLQNFDDFVLYTSCTQKFCNNCSDTNQKSSRFNNRHGSGGGYNSGRSWSNNNNYNNNNNNNNNNQNGTVSQKLCIQQYRAMSFWAYCPNKPIAAQFPRDRIILPHSCNCLQTQCEPISNH